MPVTEFTRLTSVAIMKTKKYKIDWKEVRRRESFFLKFGRFPKKREGKKNHNRPVLMFGMNTVSQ